MKAISQSSQKALRCLALRKKLLLRPKLCRVHAAPAAVELHRMPQMQHLVINDVFHGVPGNRRMIKKAADHDRVMSGIVVTEEITRTPLAPTHLGTSHHPSKQAKIEVLKEGFQVVHSPLWRRHAFAAAYLPH